ncbi:glycoside hydrolase family 20 protein [Halosquirtibacter xylanolyticus]|uniref:glycoside hydrolase family 20 protein n=1 Tax=Halosquirtibacter xylanolyticus TaxID=3374599 RepID=UPI003747A3F5
MISCNESNYHSSNVVPNPSSYNETGGVYNLPKDITLNSNSALLRGLEKYLSSMWTSEFEGTVTKSKNNPTLQLILLRNSKEFKDGGYKLDISADGIKIYSNSRKGIFYGIQTFRQLVSKEGLPYKIQMSSITDNPKFEYRGFNLDLCRHFYSVEEVKHLIDVMASLKMNKLSLELSDDMGWRIEIKKYPLLTKVGAWRESIGFKENQSLGINTSEKKRYGGFYTQEDMRSIIHYAKTRYIEIIPQFELTNHIGAAAKAYPHLVCHQDQLDLDMTNNSKYTIACIGKDENIVFWRGVIDEISKLFPSEYIHIGSGYIRYGECQICDDCNKIIHDNNLKSYDELERIYLRKIEEYINSKGKKVIAWNNTWDFSKNKESMSMVWRREATAEMNIEKGHKFIWMPKAFYCFNNAQSINNTTKSDRADITIKDAYFFTPKFDQYDKRKRELFNGISGCLWTNNSPNFEIACYRIFPRLLVVAEKGWYGYEHKDWNDFKSRANRYKSILDHYQTQYGQPSYLPTFYLSKNFKDGTSLINIENETHASIYYTTNGNTPNNRSTKYSKPIPIKRETTIKALVIREDNSITPVVSKTFYPHKALMAHVQYKYPYLSTAGNSEYTIVDGLLDAQQSFVRNDAIFTIDLGKEEEIHKITSKWTEDQDKSVFTPSALAYFTSKDGKRFKQVFFETYGYPEIGKNRDDVTPTCFPKGKRARYIKVVAKNIRRNPSWHKNPDKFAEVSVSEIIVE